MSVQQRDPQYDAVHASVAAAAGADLDLAGFVLQEQGYGFGKGAIRGKLQAHAQLAWIPAKHWTDDPMAGVPGFAESPGMQGDIKACMLKLRGIDHTGQFTESP